jgi:hypothetical protein
VRAAELEAAGLDWTEVLAVAPDNSRARPAGIQGELILAYPK